MAYEHLSNSECLKLLKINSLECRRIKADLITFFKIFHQLVDLEVHTFFDISNSNTRGHNFEIKRPNYPLEDHIEYLPGYC